MKRLHNQYSIVDGAVVDTSDPQQMGRMKVWCPALDGPIADTDIVSLPWAIYVSPLAGQTRNFPAGSTATPTEGFMSYGMWAIPKVGAHVLVAVLYGDPNSRYYIGSFFGDHGNRSLPTGRNRPDLGNKAPVSDTFDPVQPQTDNLKVQFGGNLDASEAKTRGAYERQVGMDRDVRDGSEGYQKGVLDASLDPQTYCITTPGRHTLIFQDNPENARVRMKTANGHQIIMDDANERIYMSVNSGKSWMEMDSDGHVHVYGAASYSVSAGEDINFSAQGKINLAAGGDINIGSGGGVKITACTNVDLSGQIVNIESGGIFNVLAAGAFIASATTIDLNGPGAGGAACADSPGIVPDHEPWTRPASNSPRGKNWKA